MRRERCEALRPTYGQLSSSSFLFLNSLHRIPGLVDVLLSHSHWLDLPSRHWNTFARFNDLRSPSEIGKLFPCPDLSHPLFVQSMRCKSRDAAEFDNEVQRIHTAMCGSLERSIPSSHFGRRLKLEEFRGRKYIETKLRQTSGTQFLVHVCETLREGLRVY